MSVRDLPDVTLLIRSGAIEEMGKDPSFSRKLRPTSATICYSPISRARRFSQQFLKAHTGWRDLKILFANPPVSTQQIMHPDLYLAGREAREESHFRNGKALVPADWKLLEENVMGEFNVNEVLKQFLGQQRADALSAAWEGDRYASFENTKTKETSLVLLLALDNVRGRIPFLRPIQRSPREEIRGPHGTFPPAQFFPVLFG